MRLSLAEVGGKRAVLIAGPTASGKSMLARELAGEAPRLGRPAWIVNADSMQVYDSLRVLTARPGPEDEARTPHKLYGHVPPETRYSVAAWLRDVSAVLADVELAGALLIVVGGTGLYFKALTQGLAPMPPIPAEIRAHWDARLQAEGPAALHAELRNRDPASAAAIRPGDSQRIARALEVIEGTGRSPAEWQKTQGAPPLLASGSATSVVLEPDRHQLYGRIDERVDAMVREEAVEEVAALLRRGLDPNLPVMKAIGVKQLACYLQGKLPLDEAAEAMKTETRRYAKRQITWFRNQMPGWQGIPA